MCERLRVRPDIVCVVRVCALYGEHRKISAMRFITKLWRSIRINEILIAHTFIYGSNWIK